MSANGQLFADGDHDHKIRRRASRDSAAPATLPDGAAGLVAQLQRSAGNAAVNTLLRQYVVQREDAPAPVEEKEETAAPIAAKHEGAGVPLARALAQRQDALPEEKEEAAAPVAAKHEGAGVPLARTLAQRDGAAPAPEDQEAAGAAVMAKHEGSETPSAPIGMEGGPVGPALADQIQSRRGGGSPLDSSVRTSMEGAFGTSFADVSVHTDSESDALNRNVSAVAFTTGSDIFFRQGAYEPGSSSGQQLLAHELTHVVQQRGMSHSGPMTVGPAGDSHEQEADTMSAAVVRQVDRDGAQQG